jgi:hypothetical protein
VTTQAASEMFRRLVADGLVAHAGGRDLHLTPAGRATADGLFPSCVSRVAVDVGHRSRLGRPMRRRCAVGDLTARRGASRRYARSPRDACTATRSTPRPRSANRRDPPRRYGGGRERDGLPDHREAGGGRRGPTLPEARALTPGARSRSSPERMLDSLTDGPRGRTGARVPRPSVCCQGADPALFHHVPTGMTAPRPIARARPVPPHRDRADRAQPPVCPAYRRHLRPQTRGHRPGAADRLREGHPRRLRLGLHWDEGPRWPAKPPAARSPRTPDARLASYQEAAAHLAADQAYRATARLRSSTPTEGAGGCR